jgi:hypothetical protein
VSESSAFEFEVATGKLKRHKFQGIYQMPAESIKAGGGTIRFEMHKIINSIWNKD